jgi:predicted nuclease of predicted toxin-antitoxin system
VDAVSVTELSPGLKDREALDLAGREGRIIVALDKDFGELVVREGKGAILLRFAPRSPRQAAEKIWQVLRSGIPLENHLIAARGHIVRVVKPKR